jgi:hypothetical protein
MVSLKLVYFLIIVTGFILGLLKYRRIYEQYILWFIPFLGYTFLIELVAFYQLVSINGKNHWWYNFFSVTEFLFLTIVFYRAIEDVKLKRVIVATGIFLFIFSLLNIILIQGWNNFHTISYRLGSLIVVIWCFFYFRQLLNFEKHRHPLKVPMFWISTGFLFYYIGFFFYINIFDFVAYSKQREFADLFRFIGATLNILLYTFIVIGIFRAWQIKA